MSAPREDLAQGHTADGRRPTSEGVFCFVTSPPFHDVQPRYSIQEGGSVLLGPGVWGLAPIWNRAHVKEATPLHSLANEATRFLKNLSLKSV